MPRSCDASEDLVELVLGDQERVVLPGDLAIGIGEVERDAVAGRHDEEVPERLGCRQPEDLRQKRRRFLLVASGDDRVVQLRNHAPTLRTESSGLEGRDLRQRGEVLALHRRPAAGGDGLAER